MIKTLINNTIKDFKDCCSNVGDLFFFSFLLLMTLILFGMVVVISVLAAIGMA